MRRHVMLKKCRWLLARLDELEALLEHVPEEQRAFVFKSTPASQELARIARFETAAEATKMQVQHIRTLEDTVKALLQRIPKRAIDELRK